MRKAKPALPPPPHPGVTAPTADVREIDLALILEPQLPARAQMSGEAMKDLKESMAAIGLIQEIAVIPRGDQFEVLAGHRRLLAARDLGWTKIRAHVYPPDLEYYEAVKLHENTVREQLNPAEEAIYIQQLIEAGHGTEKELCAILQRGPSYIAERIRLLRGDDKVFQALREDKISFLVARELNFFQDEGATAYYLDLAVKGGATGHMVRQWRQSWKVNRDQINEAMAQVDQQQSEAPPPDPYRPICALCGGDRDPWNLANVMIHRWEWESIMRMISRPSDAQERAAADMQERYGGSTGTLVPSDGDGQGR